MKYVTVTLHAIFVACLVFLCIQIYSFRDSFARVEALITKAQATAEKVEHVQEVATEKIDAASSKLKSFIGKKEEKEK